MNKPTLSLLTMLALSGCFASVPEGDTAVREVFKHDGSRQCEPDSGQSAAALRAELAAQGITVLGQRTGHDGRIYPAVCGAPTGRTQVFTIPAAQVTAAETLGYHPVGD